MPFISVRDVSVYYEIQGTGPRLLYIGGSGADLRRPPTAFDSPLPGRFEVLAYDQRDVGQTSGPDGVYTMGNYAEDAVGLLDALSWDRVHVFGVSFGGMVAQELAIRYPQRVNKLVLACSSSGGKGGGSYPIEEFYGLPMDERMRRHLPVQDLRRDAVWQQAHRDEFEAMVSRGGAPWSLRQLQARATHDTYDRLPQLKMPVLICGGAYDGQAPVANQHAIKSRIPHARLQFFEGGHGFLQQDKTAYEAVASFLSAE